MEVLIGTTAITKLKRNGSKCGSLTVWAMIRWEVLALHILNGTVNGEWHIEILRELVVPVMQSDEH